MTFTMRGILGVAILFAVWIIFIICLVFPRGIQGFAFRYYGWLLKGRMPWFLRSIRSDHNLWNIRLVGALGSGVCCFVLWLIVKNNLR
jgi:hypothetical protein